MTTTSEHTRIEKLTKRPSRKPAVLRIGIASYADLKDRAMKIARGEARHPANAPKVFFPSMESAGKILSGKNQELLNHIRARRPQSLRELGEQTGRAAPNLSRTLNTMAKYGLVVLERGKHGSIKPVVPYDTLDIVMELVRPARDQRKSA